MGKYYFNLLKHLLILFLRVQHFIQNSRTYVHTICTLWAHYGQTYIYTKSFCIVSSNELVVLDSLENSKQYKNAGKRFRVYGALQYISSRHSNLLRPLWNTRYGNQLMLMRLACLNKAILSIYLECWTQGAEGHHPLGTPLLPTYEATYT